MTNRSLLATPTPWLATGMGLVVALVCLLTGLGEGFANWLRSGYSAQGFTPLRELGEASLFALGTLVFFTFGTVVALEGTPGNGKRLIILVSGLLLVAMASPVFALWGLFWNPLILMVAMIWSGIAAMIHAAAREQRGAPQPNRPHQITVQPRRSPPNRKLK